MESSSPCPAEAADEANAAKPGARVQKRLLEIPEELPPARRGEDDRMEMERDTAGNTERYSGHE
jgi:hypothetical protein